MRYAITGGCGFLGANIAAELLRRGEPAYLLDDLSRHGSAENLAWLESLGPVHFTRGDIRSAETVSGFLERARPEVVFHLAGQVAMTTSIRDPRLDFEINLLGSINLLEAARRVCPSAVLIYSSTNKVYGDLAHLRCGEHASRYELLDYPDGVPESIGLDFHSPYGCSKGGADQYFLDYARIFGLCTIVFRHSSMYGGRQFSTIDQGWVGWFCEQALLQARGRGASFTISGNGKQVRDVLHAEDTVALYLAAARHADRMRGRAFNVGGGKDNSLSILELLALLSSELGVELEWRHVPARESDQQVFVADLSRVAAATGWRPRISTAEGIRRMLEWLEVA